MQHIFWKFEKTQMKCFQEVLSQITLAIRCQVNSLCFYTINCTLCSLDDIRRTKAVNHGSIGKMPSSLGPCHLSRLVTPGSLEQSSDVKWLPDPRKCRRGSLSCLSGALRWLRQLRGGTSGLQPFLLPPTRQQTAPQWQTWAVGHLSTNIQAAFSVTQELEVILLIYLQGGVEFKTLFISKC